jgi:hypothetical protein
MLVSGPQLRLLGFVALIASCGGSTPTDATGAQQAACTNLHRIAPCGDWSTDSMACLDGLDGYRTQAETHGCDSQYSALVTCITDLTACPSGSGTLCPTEYGALGTCVSSR